MNNKLDLKGKEDNLPRSKSGDVAFTTLEQIQNVFTTSEIVQLVNRAVYQMEYQREAHKKYQSKRQEFERPIKLIFKRLFPGESFLNMNPKQEEQVMREYAKGARE